MPRPRRRSRPIKIDGQERRSRLNPVQLGQGLYDENWLQNTVQTYPDVLPVHDIEPGFGRLLPIAREVPVAQGSIDNVFLTPSGEIVIAELKLWRNPEARRKVVAQCLDYVAGLVSLSYEQFDAACLQGQLADGKNPDRLYDLVADDPEVLNEAEFIDAVGRNLRLGRILALVVGDGIREEAWTLSQLIQSHASAQFTFALVELSVFAEQDGGFLIVPSTLARTELIERHVFVSDGQGKVSSEQTSTTAGKSKSLTEKDFYEKMAARDPNLPSAIKSLLIRLEALSVYPDWLGSLNLKREDPAGGKPINLGYIQKNGQFYTSTAGWVDRDEFAVPYHAAVAGLVGGSVRPSKGEWHDDYATLDGKSAPRIEQLLPEHEDALFDAMKDYLTRIMSDYEQSL